MNELPLLNKRRTDEINVSDYFSTARRYFDARENMDVIKICAGEWVVTDKNEMLSTILGSCVSACIRDPVAGIGGMNHFLLPGHAASDMEYSEAARYGMFAMESLINGILKAGGRKDRLEVKVFGGGNVIRHSARIGSQNARFVRSYLHRENLRIVSEDMEGDNPRKVHYYPVTGKVMIRKLRRKEDFVVVAEEARYERAIERTPPEGKIELFI